MRNSTWAFKSHRAAKRRQAEADRQAPPAAYAANEFFSGAGWSATAVMRISKRHGVAEAFWHERVPLLGRGNGKGKGHRNPNRFGKTASRSSARSSTGRTQPTAARGSGATEAEPALRRG